MSCHFYGPHGGQYLPSDEPPSVLHLAASSTTPIAYTFFQILLRHPQLQVNLQDQESGYTALHRALFVGNIRAVRNLLLRNDIDTSIKDAEGMAAYDLYNGTVDGVSLVIFRVMNEALTKHRLTRHKMAMAQICSYGGSIVSRSPYSP